MSIHPDREVHAWAYGTKMFAVYTKLRIKQSTYAELNRTSSWATFWDKTICSTVFIGCTWASSTTFTLKANLTSVPLNERNYVDFATHLSNCDTVKQQQGRVLVYTNPAENGGYVISPGFSNGFVGTIYRAYNEHRHLILRPDDVWLAITTAFGLFMGAKENAETMRKHCVDFEGKLTLLAEDFGAMDSANWGDLIRQMSDLIEKNAPEIRTPTMTKPFFSEKVVPSSTKGDARAWTEPDFSTTTTAFKAVGQVVLMGVMKHYFDYKIMFRSGLSKVTLEGTLDDWKELKEKTRHLASFGIKSLTHWSGLLDIVLQKLVDSYVGKVDGEFWSHIVAEDPSESGLNYMYGWVNVFMPFTEIGVYRLSDVNPETYDWGKIDQDKLPPSTVEVPVIINNNGHEYETIFYGGHLVCLYDPKENTIRPSLDFAIVGITGSSETFTNKYKFR